MSDLSPGTVFGDAEWEADLSDFVSRFAISFIKLELLILCYRDLKTPLVPLEVARRTGYHLKEVEANLAQLVQDGLLCRSEPVGTYQRLPEPALAAHPAERRVILRLIQEFNTRDGRLKIIYAILKALDGH